MNDKFQQLYSYLVSNNMTDLSADEFKQKYSETSNFDNLYNYLNQEGLTELSNNDFYNVYFLDGVTDVEDNLKQEIETIIEEPKKLSKQSPEDVKKVKELYQLWGENDDIKLDKSTPLTSPTGKPMFGEQDFEIDINKGIEAQKEFEEKENKVRNTNYEKYINKENWYELDEYEDGINYKQIVQELNLEEEVQQAFELKYKDKNVASTILQELFGSDLLPGIVTGFSDIVFGTNLDKDETEISGVFGDNYTDQEIINNLIRNKLNKPEYQKVRQKVLEKEGQEAQEDFEEKIKYTIQQGVNLEDYVENDIIENVAKVDILTQYKDFNFKEADAYLDKISNAKTQKEFNKYQKEYIKYLDEVVGLDIDKGVFTKDLSDGAILYNPATNTLVRRKDVSKQDQEDMLSLRDYVSYEQEAGNLPTDVDKIKELLIEKTFQIVTAGKEIMKNENYLADKQGFFRQIGESSKDEEYTPSGAIKPNEFKLIRQMIETGRIVPGLDNIEGLDKFENVAKYNSLLNEYKVLSQALLMNYDPTTLDKESFGTGFRAGAAQSFAGVDILTDDEKANIMLDELEYSFPEVYEQIPESEKTKIKESTWLYGTGEMLPPFLKIAAEFALTRKIAGSTFNQANRMALGGPKYWKNRKAIESVSNAVANRYLFGTGAVGRYGSAITNEMMVIQGRNVIASTYNDEAMSPLWAIGGVGAGIFFDDIGKAVLSSENKLFWNVYNNVTNAGSKFKIPTKTIGEGFKQNVFRPVVGATTMKIGTVGELGIEFATGEIEAEEFWNQVLVVDENGQSHFWKDFTQTAGSIWAMRGLAPLKAYRETVKNVKTDIVRIRNKSKKYLNKQLEVLDVKKEQVIAKNEQDQNERNINSAVNKVVKDKNLYEQNSFSIITNALKSLGLKANKIPENIDASFIEGYYNDRFVGKELNKELQVTLLTAKDLIVRELNQMSGKEFKSKIEQSTQVYNAKDFLRFENEMTNFENMMENSADFGYENKIEQVARLQARMNKGLKLDAMDIETLGASGFSKSFIKLLGVEKGLSEREADIFAKNSTGRARTIVLEADFAELKPGTKPRKEFINSRLKEIELQSEKAEWENQVKENKISKTVSEKIIKELDSQIESSQKKQEELIDNQKTKDEIKFEADIKFLEESASLVDTNIEYLNKAKIEEIKSKSKLTEKEIKDLESSDGWYDPVTNTIFINKDVALKSRKGKNWKRTSVGSHELLHAVLRKAFKDSEGNVTEAGKKLIDAFKSTLSEREIKYIDNQINRMYRNEKGELKDKDYEEYLNVFVDHVKNGNIKPSKEIDKILNNKSSEFNFETADGLRNFVYSFLKSSEQGKLRQEILDLVGTKKIEDYKTKSEEVKQEKEEVKTKEEEKASKYEQAAKLAEQGKIKEAEEVKDIKITRTTIKNGLTDSEGRKLKVSGKTGKYILRRDGKILGEFNTLDTAIAEIKRLYNFINNELVEKEIPGPKKSAKKPAAKKPAAKKAPFKVTEFVADKPEPLKPADVKETNAARGRYLNDFIAQSEDWLIGNYAIKNTNEWKKVDQDKKKAVKEFVEGKSRKKYSKSSFSNEELKEVNKISKDWIKEEKNNTIISRGLIGKLTEDAAELSQEELNNRLSLIDKVASSVSNIKFSKSKDVGPQINKLYDEMTSMWNDGGSDFTFQEIYKNKLLDELIGRRIDSFVLKGKPPGWTNESRADLINQTYLEFLPHIRNFNKAFHNYEKGAVKNDNLFAWINSFMNEKVGNSFKKIGLKPEFDVDVTEVKAVTYEETETQTEEREERDFSVRKKLGLNDDFKTKVFNKVKGVMGGRIPAVNSPEFKSRLEKEFERELFNTIREDVFGFQWQKRGGREVMPFNETKYDKFIRDNFLAMYEKLPLSTLSKMRSLKSGESLVKEVIDPKTGKQKRMTMEEAAMSGAKDIKAGNPVFEKFTPQELIDGEIFTEYFINPKIGRKSMRMEGLAKILAKEIAFDAVMEVVKDPAVFERMKDIYEIQDIDILGNEIEIIGKQIDRNPNLKFSSSIEPINELVNESPIFEKEFRKSMPEFRELIEKSVKSGENLLQGNYDKYFPKTSKNDNFQDFKNYINGTIENQLKINKNINPLFDTIVDYIDSIKLTKDLEKIVGFKLPSVKELVGKDGTHTEKAQKVIVEILKDLSTQEVKNITANLRRSIYGKQEIQILTSTANLKKAIGNKEKTWKSDIIGQDFKSPTKSLLLKAKTKDKQTKLEFVTKQEFNNRVKTLNKNTKMTKKVFVKLLKKLKNKYSKVTTEDQKKEIAAITHFLTYAGGMQSILRTSYKIGKIQDSVYEIIKNGSKLKSNEEINSFIKEERNRIVLEHRPPANILSKKIVEFLVKKDGKIKDIESFLENEAVINIVDKVFDNGINKFYKSTESISQQEYFNPRVLDYYVEELKKINIPESKMFLTFDFINKDGKIEKGEKIKLDPKKIKEQVIELNKIKLKNSKSIDESKVVDTAKAKTNEEVLSLAATIDASLQKARNSNLPVKKIRVFDFDDTLARTKSNVLYTMPNGKKGKLTAEEFAKKGDNLLSKGAEFDFSEFNKVVDGKKGPLFKVAEAIQKARGTEDVFILTARAKESAPAIKEFLNSVGLDIPIENITGLGDSSPYAKSQWVVEKAAEGYNDFYFADDAYKNVKAVQDALSVIDVKSKVQQAHVKYSKSVDLNKTFNDIIEDKTGIPSEQTFDQLAKGIGEKKGKGKVFLPYSAEDFLGLIYPLISKGKVGDAQLEFFNQTLFKPFARAMNDISRDRIQLSSDFKTIKNQLKNVPKNLRKEVLPGLTYENAVRIYAWEKQGIEVEGLGEKTIERVWEVMQENPELQAFADQLIEINKGDGYQYPGGDWLAGTITTDLYGGLNKGKRVKYLEEWQRNADAMFTKENMLKLEAAYGPKYVSALKNILQRMKTGQNRAVGDRFDNQILNWINGSVGVTMFLNTRSAILQTISTINYLNWKDNNPLAAGKAFANQKQYWKDWFELINSDFMKDRRSGLKINVSESEIADAAKKGGAKGVVNLLLQSGFAFTKAGDAFAIASGGATFYRNRIKTYEKQGMSAKEAKEKAFIDFQEITNESQQSARPDKISQQQSSTLGRLVLAFANTPMQYNRIMKRSFQDIVNGRGDFKSNVSKIAYYGFVQNIIFNALQSALFGMYFEDDEQGQQVDQDKIARVSNGMLDSILRGMGYFGAGISVTKNFSRKLYKEIQKEKGLRNFSDVWIELAGIMPPVQAKIRRLSGSGKTLDYNWKEAKEQGFKFSLDNPNYLAAAGLVSGVTNVPIDRAFRKADNIHSAFTNDYETWQKIALLLGWNKWDLGIEDEDNKSSSSKSKKGKIKTKTIKPKTF